MARPQLDLCHKYASGVNATRDMSSTKKAKFSCKFNPKWREKFNNEVKEVAGNVYAFSALFVTSLSPVNIWAKLM